MTKSTPSLAQPLRVLNYLEWILLGIAAIATLSPFSLGPRLARQLPPGFIRLGASALQPPLVISFGAIVCIAILGGLGRWFSRPKTPAAILQTLIEFGLSWFAILLGSRGRILFPPLLLVVVLRGCSRFAWPGRIAIASGAFSSFLLMQILALQKIEPLGIPLTRLPRLPRRFPRDVWESWQLNAALNASLLFALVLAFVLLMVGALLTAKESRDRLTQANQKLRRYALLVEDQATLQERNRIAREMHDSVGHSLTAQSIQLENVAALLRRDPDQAAARLTQARQLGREALSNVRQTVASLRSHPLAGQTLATALQKLAQEFCQTTQIDIELQGQLAHPAKLTDPSAEIKTALYRVVQEGLTNITKYSQATHVTLALDSTPKGLQLSLQDDGIGFDPSQNTTGFGLQSMAERIEAIGGQFQLMSQPGQGCKINVKV